MSIEILDKYYYYTKPIGFGSFSTVYRGTDYENKNIIAVKKINKIMDSKYFESEIECMKKMHHVNIIKFYEVIKRRKNEIYMILEYCDNGDLSEYIDNGQTLHDSKFYYEILDALQYLYKKDILHRDIKPQNILIHNWTIKLSDFGFAKTFERNTLITTFCGSPLYMAPEIINTREYNCTSDIWSLGVVLYELLTKIHPYSCDTKDELWSKIKSLDLNIDFDFIKSVPKRNLIKDLLQIKTEDRMDWEEIFDVTKKTRARSDSFTKNNLEVTQSLIIPNKRNEMISYSCIEHRNVVTDYSDTNLISTSAPNRLSNFYMDNYIKNKKFKKTSIPILGTTPEKERGLSSYLVKSIHTIKGFFY